MTRTRFLLSLLVVVVLLQLFPDRSATVERVAVIGVALYSLIWLGSRYRARYRESRRKARLAEADAQEYRSYESELASIRARIDPASPEYAGELSALHDRHREMLARKFGPA